MKDKPGPSLTRFGVSIPSDLLERFDRLRGQRSLGNRSEAIRDLIRDRLVSEDVESGAEVVGSLTLIYDHHQRGVSEALTEEQHHRAGSVISTLHVHLDDDLCLEVIVLRGKARDLRGFADHLLGIRGVRHGHLVVTSAGAVR